MQSTRHDPNLAALHASTGLPGQVVDVVVLSHDTGLLATLRDASSTEHAIWHAASADVAVDLLVGGRCGILIADLGTLRGDASALLERLNAQFPELILLATGRRDEEHTVASLISDGRIYRFLHKPISPARAAVFINAATRRYGELRNVQPLAITTIKTIAARTSSHKVLITTIVALLVLAFSALVWWLRREPEAVAPPPPPVVDQAAREKEIAELERQVVEALQAQNPQQGALAFRALQRAAPEHPRLGELEAQLLTLSRSVRPALPTAAPAPAPAKDTPPPARTQAAAPADVSPAPAEERADDEPAAPESVGPRAAVEYAPPPLSPSSLDAEELALVTRMRDRGVLIEPAGSNAYDAFIALRDRYPDAEEIRAEQQRLAFALLESARTALAAENVDAATEYLTRVETLVPGMSTTRALQQQLATARQRRDFMTNVVPASQLRRVRDATLHYPREAQRDGVEGWVDVDFTVAPDGSTQDLTVRGAEPKGVFEESALESMRRWRFQPVTRDGVAVPQRASLRVRFELN